MSDINLDFTVSNNSINFTVEPNEITITPTDIQLNLATNISPETTASQSQLLYYNNFSITGLTDVTYANGNLTLGNVSNVKITGGTNGYVLQTDGSGNLTWTAQTGGGGGNGVPGGSNTQIQYNDSGAFGGNVGFTFNEVTGNVAIPGNIIVTGNSNAGNMNATTFTGQLNGNATGSAATVTTNAQPNITSLGTLSSLSVAGTTSIQQAKEKVLISGSGATGNINIDLLNQAVYYYNSNSTSNFSILVRGNSTTTLNSIVNTGESITFSLAVKNGTPGYYANLFYIDGYLTSPLYVGGTPTNGTNNATDVYTYNLIKTGSNIWTAFGSKLGFA
jgi:hypothetical protein